MIVRRRCRFFSNPAPIKAHRPPNGPTLKHFPVPGSWNPINSSHSILDPLIGLWSIRIYGRLSYASSTGRSEPQSCQLTDVKIHFVSRYTFHLLLRNTPYCAELEVQSFSLLEVESHGRSNKRVGSRVFCVLPLDVYRSLQSCVGIPCWHR
jgi:hypothetical protein